MNRCGMPSCPRYGAPSCEYCVEPALRRLESLRRADEVESQDGSRAEPRLSPALSRPYGASRHDLRSSGQQNAMLFRAL